MADLTNVSGFYTKYTASAIRGWTAYLLVPRYGRKATEPSCQLWIGGQGSFETRQEARAVLHTWRKAGLTITKEII